MLSSDKKTDVIHNSLQFRDFFCFFFFLSFFLFSFRRDVCENYATEEEVFKGHLLSITRNQEP